MNEILVAPSLLCTNLLELQSSVARLEAAGFPLLHVDIISGGFAPETPLSIELINLLRPHMHTPLDVHIMSTDNEEAIHRLVGADVKSMCFHAETARHVDRLLRLIRREGIRAGLALMPGTPLSALDYVAELCDYVLLMLINPGYASQPGEAMVEYAMKKVRDLREFLDRRGLESTSIEVDGRVSLEAIPPLIAAGADVLVAGSSCLFGQIDGLAAASARITQAVALGVNQKTEGGHLA